jgi:hypothetical protein
MELVELETKKEFDAFQEITKGLKYEHISFPGSFAGAMKTEAEKWKWIKSGVLSYNLPMINKMQSYDHSKPCLMYDKDYFNVCSCEAKTSKVICEKNENGVSHIAENQESTTPKPVPVPVTRLVKIYLSFKNL